MFVVFSTCPAPSPTSPLWPRQAICPSRSNWTRHRRLAAIGCPFTQRIVATLHCRPSARVLERRRAITKFVSASCPPVVPVEHDRLLCVCLCVACRGQVFVKLLWSWLISTTVGNITFGLLFAVFLCVFMGCFCQHVECSGCKIKRKPAPVRGSVRDHGWGALALTLRNVVGGASRRSSNRTASEIWACSMSTTLTCAARNGI